MSTTHHLNISVTPDASVLERIVSACRSRQCSIVSLEYRAGDPRRPGHVSMTLEGADRMVGLAENRLARLVDVLAVDRGRRSGAAPLAGVAAADPGRQWS